MQTAHVPNNTKTTCIFMRTEGIAHRKRNSLVLLLLKFLVLPITAFQTLIPILFFSVFQSSVLSLHSYTFSQFFSVLPFFLFPPSKQAQQSSKGVILLERRIITSWLLASDGAKTTNQGTTTRVTLRIANAKCVTRFRCELALVISLVSVVLLKALVFGVSLLSESLVACLHGCYPGTQILCLV